MCQQFAVDEVFAIVDDKHHDSLRYHVASSFCNDFHVRVNQITNCFNLTLQLWVKRASLAYIVGLL